MCNVIAGKQRAFRVFLGCLKINPNKKSSVSVDTFANRKNGITSSARAKNKSRFSRHHSRIATFSLIACKPFSRQPPFRESVVRFSKTFVPIASGAIWQDPARLVRVIHQSTSTKVSPKPEIQAFRLTRPRTTVDLSSTKVG